jgi:limonene 1,2-monooxygenase
VIDQSGGFGTCVGFVHDWANPENTFRSWDMVARYVIPEINGYVTKLRESQKYLQDNRAVFDRAGQAIMAKIMENKDAAEALKVTTNPRVSAAAAQVPKGLKDQAAE